MAGSPSPSESVTISMPSVTASVSAWIQAERKVYSLTPGEPNTL